MTIKRYTAVITKGDQWYVAQCLEVAVVSQGKTIKEAQANLKEAVEVYLESLDDEDLPDSTSEAMFYLFEVTTAARSENEC